MTPAQRALLEERLRGGPESGASTSIAPRPAEAGSVVSFGQERLWYLYQRHPSSPAYNLHVSYRLEGSIDVARLAAGVNQVIQRHDVLRTAFDRRDGRPVARVVQDLVLNVPFEDLTTVPPDRRETIVASKASDHARRAFNLAEAPLVRMSVLRVRDDEHRLLLTLHHAVADEWSLPIFWREVGIAYRALSNTRAGELEPLPLQYADFAHWQRERTRGGHLHDQLAYWQPRLDPPVPVLDLPIDKPRPPRLSLEGDLKGDRLPESLGLALRDVAKQHKTSLFVLLLAAFKTLLHRYTGETDVVVGTPISNRTLLEVQALIGFFVNTLILRSDLAGDPPFLEVVERVRRASLEAFANQDVPFEELVRRSQPHRSLAHDPLIQVMFVLQQEAAAIDLGPDVRAQAMPPVDSGASKFDLTLFIAECQGGLETRIEYRTDLFQSETIDRMLGHWRRLLETVAAAPEIRISEIDVLSDAERNRLLVEWNDTAADWADDRCVHALVATQAKERPGAIAVSDEGQSLTYRQLDERAESLARFLRSLGIGPDDRVGIYAERSVEMVVAVLGVLSAGGAYVPVDPDHPNDRSTLMLEDAGVEVLLTQRHLLSRLPRGTFRTVCLDPDQGNRAWVGAGAPPTAAVTASGDHLAYVIYTSGSTGPPKGVMVTHRNLAHSTLARRRHYDEHPSRFLLVPSFAVDSSVAGIFGALCFGGTVILPPQGAEHDASRIAALIAAHEVTHLLCLPSLYAILLEHHAPELESLRVAIVAGEACPSELACRHHALLSGTQLYNEYGPTEATVWSTVYQSRATDRPGPVPIGRPIANCQAFVLDRHRRPVPIGVTGELYIGGAGVARGYLNQQGLTDAAFVRDPVGRTPGARLYRTGDRVRYRPDGNLVFVGRTDRQVKIRGHRIELGEIEAGLMRHAAVAEAAVIGAGPASRRRPDSARDVEAVTDAAPTRLVAYVVPVAGSAPTRDDLRLHLTGCLPRQMVPSVFVRLAHLPRTSTGKVDYRALPSPDDPPERARGDGQERLVPPRSDAEEVLAGIWRDVLGQDQIGVHDNFFEVGGDSLLSIRVLARARERGLSLSSEQFFEHPTIARQVAVAERVSAPDAPAAPESVPSGSKPGTLTSTDFPLAGLDQADLDHLSRILAASDRAVRKKTR